MIGPIQPQHVQYIALGGALLCFLIAMPACQYDIVFTPPWKKQQNVAANTSVTFFTDAIVERINTAKQHQQPVFIDFYTSWCGPCKRMDKDVFCDTEVALYFNEKFVSIKADAEKGEGKTLATQLGITSYPTLIFLDSGGNEENRITGFSSSAKLLKNAKKIK